ncbi:MAG: hypothetical protein MI725_17230 [Pirellulales bacterium]|nr:hypothetical protein [Pirellulales bacterium]
MNCLIPKLVLPAVLVVGGLSLPTVGSEPVVDGQAVPGLVVLDNGNVVRGQVQLLGDHYLVKLSGGELRIPTEQVEMFCRDLNEAYQKRRASRTATSADAHIDLARWCMRYDLHDHAARELTDAREIDPDHRRLPLFERQLQQLVKLAARTPSSRPSQQAETSAEPTEVELKTLDKAPKWARALFVRQVQPLLVHSCATAGCHQPGATGGDFQLNRLATDGVGHPQLTLRNLASTLAQIDWQSPEESRLLQQALTAHGGAEEKQRALLTPHKLRLLRLWVEQLAMADQIRESKEMLAAAPTGDNPLQPASSEKKKAAEPIELARYEQRDPFDADFFNRRYAQRPAALAATPSLPSPGAPPPLATPGE